MGAKEMTELNSQPVVSRALTNRVRNILLHPASEWTVIEAEPSTIRSIFANYVCILAAIPPLATAIGSLAFGRVAFGLSSRPGVLSVLVAAVVQYILSVASVFILALVAEAVAPMFGGRKDRTQAVKLAAYSATASWLAGIFYIVPAVSPLAIVGLYSLYLFYLGAPKLMKPAEDKALLYTAVVIVSAFVLMILVSLLTAPIMAMGVAPAPAV